MKNAVNIAICLLYVLCARAYSADLAAGDGWIANDTVRVRLEWQASDYQRWYYLYYDRRKNSNSEWEQLLQGKTPVRGMGYYLLAVDNAPSEVRTELKPDRAVLTYTLAGTATDPEEPISISFQVTIWQEFAGALLEVTERSHERLSLMARFWGSNRRYVFHDESTVSGYKLRIIDAAECNDRPPTVRMRVQRFAAAASSSENFVTAVLNPISGLLSAQAPPARGTGFGWLEFHGNAVLWAETSPAFADFATSRHAVVNAYHHMHEILSK